MRNPLRTEAEAFSFVLVVAVLAVVAVLYIVVMIRGLPRAARGMQGMLRPVRQVSCPGKGRGRPSRLRNSRGSGAKGSWRAREDSNPRPLGS